MPLPVAPGTVRVGMTRNGWIRSLFFVALVSGACAVCGGELIKRPASPDDGFDWPFYLYVPAEVDRSAVHAPLLVMPNNTGWMYDDFSIHDEEAQKRMERLGRPFADELGTPVLIPVFPRPENSRVYTHVLDRDCLTTHEQGLVRLDLQLIAMIDDARRILDDCGIRVRAKVLLQGFSAGGSFSNRFALLHPELVLGVAAGGVGFISLPVPVWGGRALRYGIGVSDLESLTGQGFDMSAYAAIPQFLFVGEQDENDPVNTGVGFEEQDRIIIIRLFGDSHDEWWDSAVTVFESIDANVEFKVYPNVGHKFTFTMQADVVRFFREIIEQ